MNDRQLKMLRRGLDEMRLASVSNINNLAASIEGRTPLFPRPDPLGLGILDAQARELGQACARLRLLQEIDDLIGRVGVTIL